MKIFLHVTVANYLWQACGKLVASLLMKFHWDNPKCKYISLHNSNAVVTPSCKADP